MEEVAEEHQPHDIFLRKLHHTRKAAQLEEAERFGLMSGEMLRVLEGDMQ